MSYDVAVGAQTFNYTYNLGRFITAYFGNPYKDWHYSPASAVLKRINAGFEIVTDANLAHLKRLFDAPNGWGDVLSCLGWLWEIRDALRDNPDVLVEVH